MKTTTQSGQAWRGYERALAGLIEKLCLVVLIVEGYVTLYRRGFDLVNSCSIIKRKKDISYVQAMGFVGLCFCSSPNSYGMRSVFTI